MSRPAYRRTDGDAGTAPGSVGGALEQTVRYRGFVLMQQGDLTWLIRAERGSLMEPPFLVPASSLSDVQALVDWRLAQAA
jgi:hypothetical protein